MNVFNVEMVKQLNIARQNPTSLIADVQASTAPISDKNETIQFLQTVKPCTNTLVFSPELSLEEQKWVNEQGMVGNTGHGDFLARIATIGRYRKIGENLAYGITKRYTQGDHIPQGYFLVQGYENGGIFPILESPRDQVIAWIIDQGYPFNAKGHRNTIYDCLHNSVGVGFGIHTKYRTEVGLLFAQDYQPY
jgi:hypothetical protein